MNELGLFQNDPLPNKTARHDGPNMFHIITVDIPAKSSNIRTKKMNRTLLNIFYSVIYGHR